MSKLTVDLPPHPNWTVDDKIVWQQLPHMIELKFKQLGRKHPTNTEFNGILRQLLTPMPPTLEAAVHKIASFLGSL